VELKKVKGGYKKKLCKMKLALIFHPQITLITQKIFFFDTKNEKENLCYPRNLRMNSE